MNPARRVINLDRIRGRVSYRWFKDAAAMFAWPDDREGFLRWLYGLLDSKQCFGSRLNAARAEEALELVLREQKNCGGLDKCPECGGDIEVVDTRWADFDLYEVSEQCEKCNREFCTSFMAMQWHEVKP